MTEDANVNNRLKWSSVRHTHTITHMHYYTLADDRSPTLLTELQSSENLRHHFLLQIL